MHKWNNILNDLVIILSEMCEGKTQNAHMCKIDSAEVTCLVQNFNDAKIYVLYRCFIGGNMQQIFLEIIYFSDLFLSIKKSLHL